MLARRNGFAIQPRPGTNQRLGRGPPPRKSQMYADYRRYNSPGMHLLGVFDPCRHYDLLPRPAGDPRLCLMSAGAPRSVFSRTNLHNA